MHSNCVNFVYVCVHRLLKYYKIWYIIYAMAKFLKQTLDKLDSFLKKNRFVKKNKNH